ncbi:PTS system mannose/fructose/N-acetylgalactosamine-transporter subunit IIB [Levilactobacillus bambusae]|uniref:PTS fructose transporter subunit IIB n=1 Tax=Levilactobacillus bambusae TaxID=2024736 RepID=A0A2V1MY02_9LACO|nr:PTS sugar transporter subunit IIB [Levilactobacillus bambusae]PWF99407.1 PTS fructose transporter subunit IIB [Levilactobacillus bambusae]
MSLTIKLARIDSRLIHGQVVTGWARVAQPNRILVVDDTVAQDSLQKTLLKQAAPAGMKVNCITVEKMIQIWGDPKFDVIKALVLTKGPEAMAEMVKGGVSIPEVNVGNMTFEDGKTVIASNLAVSQEDVDAFNYLHDQGVKLSRQMVPGDSAVDVMDLLKKADLE